MLRLGAIAAAAAFVTSGPAFAADLSYGAPTEQLYSPVSAVNWTGAHIGLNLGGGSGNLTGVYSGSLFGGSVNGVPVVPFGLSGILGGVQIGYDLQNDHFVFGIEGDIDASGVTGTGRQFTGSPNVDATLKQNWIGTFRGRLGYAFDRLLFYATGGVAVANYTLYVAASNGSAASGSQTHLGWTLGLGAEYALTQNWSIGGEYRYADLGTKRYTDPVNIPSGSADVHVTSSVFLAKVNYHW